MKSIRPLLFSIVLMTLSISLAAIPYQGIYLPGYTPIIYNQPDIYKINKGLEFNKDNPYIINMFGVTYTRIIDYDKQTVTISSKIGDEQVYPDIIIPLDDYLAGLQNKVYHSTLISAFLTPPEAAQNQTAGLIKDIVIDLPNVAIPKSIRKILGNKAGKLNLDGTQKVTISTSSTKRDIGYGGEANRGNKFDFKMQQDTNLRLNGTVGEKIAVNMQYNSNQDETLFDPNNINVKYTGDEDEIVQSVEAGNIQLSLSGSRYINYPTQGLFGISSKWKVGALDLTMLASKEEGQKNTQSYIGQSQADSVVIHSKNFTTRTFYYLEKPQLLYQIYSAADTVSEVIHPVPKGWVGNRIKTNTDGTWMVNTDLLPTPGTLRVFMDDGLGNNNQTAIPGDSVYISPGNGYRPMYDELLENTDFVVDYTAGFIEIKKTVDRLATIAVVYTNRSNQLIPANGGIENNVVHAKVLRKRNQEYNPQDPNSTWDYTMRNIYSMGIENIKNDGFSLNVYSENEDRTPNYQVPRSIYPGIMTFNEYLRLNTSGSDVVNGDDATVNLSTGYIYMPFISPFYGLGDVVQYQEENEIVQYTDYKHFISIKGKIGRDMIDLRQTGILKGSVKVRVDGKVQKENVDYIVDYDMGQITFLTAAGKNPDAKIEIDYEFRNGFAASKKSLAGLRADWNISSDTKLGGTMIYRTESVAEKRPRIGNENLKLFMADVDGTSTWRPKFVTRLIDALPLIKTNDESHFTLSGEMALTVPRLSGDSNNKNAAYVDDMEGILDAYPLGVSYTTWVMGSKPWQTSLPKANIQWYNVKNAVNEDVYDNLNAKEAKESISILDMHVFPSQIGGYPPGSRYSYAGIMKYLGNQLDFSNKKYIEFVIKLETPANVTRPDATLHVDLGDINEDFYTDYGGLNVKNTEDKNGDGALDYLKEDTGLDGIYDNAPNAAQGDPNDDWSDNESYHNTRINGTENNQRLDTEDLDGNGVLNQLDRYLSYSVSLSNTNMSSNTFIKAIYSKGYMLVRIPLNDETAFEVVNNSATGIPPTLKKISYIRLWADTNADTNIRIASMSVVGNKWEDFHIRNENDTVVQPTILSGYNEQYQSGVQDTKVTDHYAAPPGTVVKENNEATTEQSLTLYGQNIQSSHKVLLRQRLIEAFNLLAYEKIKFWVYPESNPAFPQADVSQDALDIIFRIGADSLNYYQVVQTVPLILYGKMDKDSWLSLDFDLQDFSSLKTSENYTDHSQVIGKRIYTIKGRPTLTNIKEFTLGYQPVLPNHGAYTGTVYFDDMRVTDPYEASGVASHVTLNAKMADFITLDVDYENKSTNFNPNMQRGRTQLNSYSTNTTFTISNKYFLGKLFPDNWGLDLPLTLSRNYSLGIPLYRYNSDLKRDNIADAYTRKRERSESLAYGAEWSFGQHVTPHNPILAYTINKMTLAASINNTIRNSAIAADTTLAWRVAYNYNFNLPENFLSLPLSSSYRLHFVPGTWSNNVTVNSSEPISYDWTVRDTLQAWLPRPQTVDTKTINTDNSINWTMTPDLSTSYRIYTKRDLTQRNYFRNVNVGKESEYNQEVGVNYNPAFLPSVFTLTNSATSRYGENQRRTPSTTGNPADDLIQRDGNSTRNVRSNLTLQNSDLLQSWANAIASKHNIDRSEGYENGKGMTDNKDESKIDWENSGMSEEEKKKFGDMLKNNDSNTKPDKPEKPNKPEKPADELVKKEEPLPGKDEMVKEGEYQDAAKLSEDIPAPDDTTATGKTVKQHKAVYLPYTLVNWLSKFKNVTASYQNTYTQVYTRKDIRPNYGFQMGLPNMVAPGFLDSKNDDNSIDFGSGITFSRQVDTSLNYSYSVEKRFADASNKTISTTFPDVTLTLTEVDSWLHVSKYLRNMRLNSSYQYTLRQNGDINWVLPKQETRTWSLNPLLSVNADVLSDIQTTLSLTYSKTLNLTRVAGSADIVRSTDTRGVNGNISYSYSEGKGFTIPLIGKRVHIRNELTSTLAVQYEKNYDTTKGSGPASIDRKNYHLVITPTAGYQFDQNIKGGLTGSFDRTRDDKNHNGTRIISVGVWVEINL